ncbi:site-2 protease family protein [uncultured Sulfitobacter sp.]|uniref:site-2 protease family protein n=1 Tax=uncultured Sulfitobacter sp. TaxID=191468 RepID=UPI00262DB84A|nr:site-2 protease family protein [uncultured Sulfitobacter sp.]
MWGNGVRIARLFGFDIKIDASWLLIATLVVWSLATVYFPARLPEASLAVRVSAGVLAMLGLFGSLILHELAHALVARRWNIEIKGITLFLFGGVAEMQSEPESAASEFRIAIAGPLASLAIALCFWITAHGTAHLGAPPAFIAVLSYLAWINLLLAVFNLLPAFPMDGGRVLRAWLWGRSGNLLEATRRATAIAVLFAYGLIGLGLYATFSGSLASGLWPALIGLFLLATSRAALAQVETGAALEGRLVCDLMTSNVTTARPDLSLNALVHDIFLEQGVSFVPVVEDDALLGYVDLQMARKIDREHWHATRVEDVLETAAPDNTVDARTPGRDLLTRMTREGRRKFLVTQEGQLAGIVTLADVLGFLSVFRELG